MRKYIYADEAGNFDFSRNRSASQYFILTTVSIEDHSIESDLLNLRRELVWEGNNLPGPFHASTDKQQVRDRVFDVLSSYDFRVDATVIEKSKSMPRIRTTEEAFYKLAWFYHMKYLANRVASPLDDLLVIAASIGEKKKLAGFRYGLQDVVQQTSRSKTIRVDMWPFSVDPCLQVADYCCWAIQRKWESNDNRSHIFIQNKIRSEYDLFRRGTTHYY